MQTNEVVSLSKRIVYVASYPSNSIVTWLHNLGNYLLEGNVHVYIQIYCNNEREKIVEKKQEAR